MGNFEVIRDKAAMRHWTRSMKKDGDRVALVPTMGYLHEGHLSLVREAKARANRVVVSIYVNPGQFAPGEDLSVYPRDLENDLAKLEPMGVDAVFNPYDLYVRDQSDQDSGLIASDSNGSGHETWVRVERLEKPLCGVNRPMFFRGVATVVTKLFHIVEPDVAIFGKKDYQQFRVLCRMVRDLDFDIEMVGAPLLREQDGLAMSSRNVRLSAEERQKALSISLSLRAAEESVRKGERDASVLIQQVQKTITEAGGHIDYVEIAEQESLRPVITLNCPVVLAVAVRFGNVRLLDNVEI
ncbi:hypothetical protein R1flu_002933 [Riccia fluitans]|uniref:Pantoate--beta-alanine ligase n=1 Tax=Riccia fluitans TaxID=41844 RepID=A0ABD1Y7R2_9MARC